MPPLKGVFFLNTTYYYQGSADAGRQFVVGGNVVAGLEASLIADFPTVLWVPTTNFLGGTLAVGGILPFGEPSVDVSAVLTGPLGRQFDVSRSESKFIVGDPVMMAALGWRFEDIHIQTSTLINIPIGDYRAGHLANLAFHRWAVDTSFAVTWHNETTGWDLSGKAGFTFNGTNESTDYDTGTEFHLEGSVEKALSRAFSVGLQAYYFNQVTGDSGAGATLGSFKGRVTGLGGTAAYKFALGKVPVTLRLHGASEFEAQNRLEGHAIWLDLSFPLAVTLPTTSAPTHTALLL